MQTITSQTISFKSFLGTLYLFLIINALGIAQTTIQGTVMDNINNIPVEGANIEIVGTPHGTFSDETGAFSLKINEKLPVQVTISSMGYELKEINITAASDNLLVSLVPGALVGQEVIISASRKREKLQEAPSATDVVDEQLLKSDVVVNPFLSLRNRVGIDVVQTGVNNGHITLRGRTSAFQTETFVIADYRNLIQPGLGAIGYNQQPIDPIDLEKIEIVKGPGSALYGPGVEAGVVHFISKSPFDLQGTTVSAGIGTQSTYQLSFRHADILANEKLAYKFTGFYRRSRDWEIDPSDPQDSVRLAQFLPEIRSSLTDEIIASGEPNYNVESIGLTGELVYRPDDETLVTVLGGWSIGKGIFRTAEGEGYAEIPRPFGQVRVQAGGFFGQMFYSSYDGSDGRAYLYTSGRTTIFEGHQFEGQFQYNVSTEEERLNVIFGLDYRLNTVNTNNTVHGRWEDEDNYTIIGGYTQAELKLSKKVDLIAAARFDQFVALEEFAFSPRLALVYKPTPKHTIRGTFNRAFGAPSSINLFADFPISNNGAFLVQLMGGSQPLTYSKPRTTSLIQGVPTTDGIGMDLQVAYAAITQELVQQGLFDENTASFLGSLGNDISGFSAGVLNQELRPRTERLKLSSSNMYEIGYQGLFSDKLSISLDIFYNQRKNIFSTPFQAGAFVLQPTLANDLAEAISKGVNEADLEGTGLTKESLITIYATAAQGVAIDGETGAPNPLGIIQSDQAPLNAPLPLLDLTYYNIDELDYFGVDIAAKYYFTGDFSAFGSISLISQTFFDNLPIRNQDSETSLDYSLNIPDTKIKTGVEYYPEYGFNGFFAIRYQSAWESAAGLPFTGPVDEFTIFDLSGGYTFQNNVSCNLTITNLFDADYRGFYGSPKIGRQLMARAYYHF